MQPRGAMVMLGPVAFRQDRRANRGRGEEEVGVDTLSVIVVAVLAVTFDGHNSRGVLGIADGETRLALRAPGMWRGFKGSPNPEPGLRQHSDRLWYPKRAFRRKCGSTVKGSGCLTDHQRWCQAQYWSYRVVDDTFQPYDGKRRPCISPFSR